MKPLSKRKLGRKSKRFTGSEHRKVFRRACMDLPTSEMAACINVHKATVNRWLLTDDHTMGNAIKLGRMLHELHKMAFKALCFRQEETDNHIVERYPNGVVSYVFPDDSPPVVWDKKVRSIKRFCDDKEELIDLLKRDLKVNPYAWHFGWDKLE